MPPKNSGVKRPQPLVSPDVKSQTSRTPKKKGVSKNVIHADPAFLETLGQSHSGWIFGAIAEFVDNSKDAKAANLDISIETHYSEIDKKRIPFLSLIDDGCGMSHEELVIMLSLGNKKFHEDDKQRIGKYGIGFKTGAMKLGRDVMVLTQTAESRSVAFLSQTYSKGKDELDLPIVSYSRIGSVMKLDTNVQTQRTADRYLDIMEEFSPFDKYFIGEKFGLFGENGQGTQVYIWNLERSGSDFSLEWRRSDDVCDTNGNDILIRSRRTRQRPGQRGQQVPLDYSLRAYLEVIFLDIRMKISIQRSVVKSRLVVNSLDKAKIMDGNVHGKPVQLVLGHCQQEWKRQNSGIFLYWHGRLIEAYKRFGHMVDQLGYGRGVIGVVDVTDVMRDKGCDLVHNTKQVFQDSLPYIELEKWLDEKLDEYCGSNQKLPHGTCNVNMGGPKQPSAEKAPTCSRKHPATTINVGLTRSGTGNDSKVNVGPKQPAAEKFAYYARKKSTASTSNAGSDRSLADLGFRKRFTRSSMCPQMPKVDYAE